ncbi:MAG: ribosomal protein [Planctomycetota bacterium]|jgi:small subunit ribosomal protein S8
MMTDPIADFCTRLRNANSIKQKQFTVPASTVKVGIAQVLKDEGFITDYRVEPNQPRSTLVVALKYGDDGQAIIRRIARVSKPGRRVYAGSRELRPVLRGMGIRVMSTPAGIISDRAARNQKLGGEILCEVY